jgi:ankyrin repeat protein
LETKRDDPYSLLAERDFGALTSLLEEKPELALARHPDGYSLIHAAAEVAPVELVQLLVSLGADINEQDKWGETPIFYAVDEPNVPVAEMLLSIGAQLDTMNYKGHCPIYVVAIEGNIDAIEFLLAHNVPIDQKTEYGSTALHVAVCGGYEDLVDYLIGHGADVNARDSTMGKTPLHYAIDLIRYGWDSLLKMAELLLERGADPNIKDNNGKTAWHLAREFTRNDLVLLLQRYGEEE